MNTTSTRRPRLLASLAIAATLVVGSPIAAAAAPPTPEARIVPTACRYETRYHWDWFQCWSFFGGPVSSKCWYRVYTCS